MAELEANDDACKPSLAARLASGFGGIARRLVVAIVFALLVLLGVRAWQSTQGPPLRAWHTTVPDELAPDIIVAGDWAAYVAAEQRMFTDVNARLQRAMTRTERTPLNRYDARSLVSPTRFDRDWNRSFELEPAGEPRGVVVLLHGLSDSPYSLRTLGELYQAHGFVVVAPRLPGHGTVPAGLTRVGREHWYAAVEMAMAHARRRAGERVPVHVVAYSNGAALALRHVLARLERGEPAGVEQIVLLSPMVEVSGFARYVGLAGLPAVFGRYARSAWLDVLPEYNPFKYNSFPVRAARESYLVTTDLRAAIASVERRKKLAEIPPILAFQSVLDDTVDARGVMTRLFDKLPANGSELVLFDINRSRAIAPMLEPGAADWAHDALQAPARRYSLTVVGVASADDPDVVARTRVAGADVIREQATPLRYPADVYSLSHIALPFPDDDPLYGNRPSPSRNNANAPLQLGGLAVRGERRGLLVAQDSLGRLSYNPFHAWMRERIVGTMR